MSVLITGNDDIYPAWRHSKYGESQLVHSLDQDEDLGDDWADSMSAFDQPASEHMIEEDEFKDMKARNLVAYAQEHGLDIGGLVLQSGRVKLLTAIRSAMAPAAPPSGSCE